MKQGESSESAQVSYAGDLIMHSSDWQEQEQREAELLKQNELNTVEEEELSDGKHREKQEQTCLWYSAGEKS